MRLNVAFCKTMRALLLIPVLFSLTNVVWAQESLKTRPMALADCVQQALEHNLALQIERINPRISSFNLSGSYAGWDPVFNISGTHSFSRSGGGIDPNTKLPSPS